MSKLLQILDGNEPLQEIQGLKNLFKSFIGSAAPETEPLPPVGPPEKEEDLDDASYDGALQTIASEMIQIPTGRVRVVVYLTHMELKKSFLVSGGSGAKIIEEMSDEDILKMTALNGSGTAMAINGQTVKIDSLVAPPSMNYDRAVLLNVPTGIVKYATDSVLDIDKAKPALTELLNHKFYVMTLNIPKVAKSGLRSKFPSGGTADDLAEVMDIAIIENYPKLAMIAKARVEWRDLQKKPEQDREAEVTKAERDAELEARKRTAQQSNVVGESQIESMIMNEIASYHEKSQGQSIVASTFVDRNLVKLFRFGKKDQVASKADVASAAQSLFKKYKIDSLQEVVRLLRGEAAAPAAQPATTTQASDPQAAAPVERSTMARGSSSM